MAANTDNFIKTRRTFSTTIGTGGVADGTTTTIPLASTTNLPTDTAVCLTINRVDSNGAITNNSETYVGVVSGTNTINCTRGVEGTAQAWVAGIVVELLWCETNVNRLVTGILVGHNQDGSHISNLPLTTPEITTGLKDANGNTIIGLSPTTGSVNYPKITNAATGNAPQISPDGTDSNIDMKLVGKGIGMVEIDAHYGAIQSDTDGATVTFDLSKGNDHSVTLGGNRTLALSNVKVGQKFILELIQDATGSRTVTWFSTIKWAGGSAPTLTTTANKKDIFGFRCTSAGNYDGFIVGQNL